ncbi:hypothetical protein F0562_035708 [Nyssa sinensis]|uniref:BHLH domain-containing protein n=1 Tax=Nyssa sinensis TaxID=561372 RepID=A0A5J5ABQ9_9ASTE|nr:hypothetical protein F0562_035708 [Nyssa sinensis]
MLPFQNDCLFQSIANRNGLVLEPNTMKTTKTGSEYWSSSSESMSRRKKSEAASKRHAIQEQKRRQRINEHLTTLRELLIPNMNSKTAKASILTETVRQVRELRKRAAEVAAALRRDGDECGGCSDGSRSFWFPGDGDEATVSYCEDGSEGRAAKATVCCEDRPGLNRELTEAIRFVGATAIRAEMATIGGRTKAELVVQWREGGGEEGAGSLKRALKAVVENRALDFSGLGHVMSVNTAPGLGYKTLVSKRARSSSSIHNGVFDHNGI